MSAFDFESIGLCTFSRLQTFSYSPWPDVPAVNKRLYYSFSFIKALYYCFQERAGFLSIVDCFVFSYLLDLGNKMK